MDRCLVVETVPGSSADKSGIKSSDIIIGMNGRKVSRVEELTVEIMKKRAGEVVEIDVIRDGVGHNVKVRLEEIK